MNGHLETPKFNWIYEYILNPFHQLFAANKKNTIYDYTCKESGVNYFFDTFNQGMEGYLTSQEEKIKEGVFILLYVDETPQTYQVREVSFYASPADMWTAHLAKVKK
jgi:hypothetical protein